MSLTLNGLVELALQTTGMTRERWDSLSSAMHSDASMNQVMRDDWNAKPRDSEAAIREYYRESDIWFLNTFNQGVGALLSLVQGSVPYVSPWQKAFLMEFNPVESILDYGGGFLKDSWQFISSGRKVALAEVRGPVTSFLSEFVKLAGLVGQVEILSVDEDLPLKGTYRGAVCFETLEHLLRPVELTRHLHEHLAPGSPFAFSVSFGDAPHAPYHVAQNAPFGDGKVWSAQLEEIGFRRRWRDEQGQHIQIWERT